jgi:hypothetical protein
MCRSRFVPARQLYQTTPLPASFICSLFVCLFVCLIVVCLVAPSLRFGGPALWHPDPKTRSPLPLPSCQTNLGVDGYGCFIFALKPTTDEQLRLRQRR